MPKEDGAAVNDQVVADTTATDSAPEEKDSLEVVMEGAPLNPNDFSEEAETESSTDSDATDETEADTHDENTPSPEEEFNQLKGSTQDRIRQLANERREALARAAELEAQQAQFATEQDLINEINPETGEYYTPQEIERISWQKGREAQAERVNQEIYQNQVRENQLAINEEALKVQELPVFNPQSKDFNPEIAEQYAELLSDNLVYQLPDGRQANHSTLVANGINPDTQATLVGVNTSPLKLAKTLASAITATKATSEVIGQAKAQKATARMMANVDEAASNQSGASKANLESMSADEYAKSVGLKKTWY